jgi:hypothetical protein
LPPSPNRVIVVVMATKQPDDEDEFWERMLAMENGPLTTNFDQLLKTGVELPAPERLDDLQLHRALWNVILALADRRVFIEHTDHLSDRDLYTQLWHRTLREEVPDVDDDDGVWHVNILGGWSEEDTQVFLRHYADDKWRRDWLEDFPDYEMPPHQDPAYDRDRHLPKPHEEPSVP